MKRIVKSGSSLFYDDPKDKDLIIITDEDITRKDLERETGVDKFIYYTHKENSLEYIFFTIMTLRLQNLTTDPVYIKERPRLQESLYNEFKIKHQRENSKLSWWYLLALKELDGTLKNLTEDDIKDVVRRSKEFELTEQEKDSLRNIHNIKEV